VPGGHNGLTEVGSDVAARANVTCTRPVPCPFVGQDGYAVNDQALFASNLAKGSHEPLREQVRETPRQAADVFASNIPGFARANRPIPEPLLVPGLETAGTIPLPSRGGISEQPEMRRKRGVRARDAHGQGWTEYG
jgi:hypothetical protein